jgi:hypothetical protein
MNISQWFSKDKKGTALTKEFYNLSLEQKYVIIKVLEDNGTLLKDRIRYDRLVAAVLQHSPEKLKNEYPIQWERSTRPEARKADKRDLEKWSLQAILMNFDKIFSILTKSGIVRGIFN